MVFGLFSQSKQQIHCAYCEHDLTVTVPKNPETKAVDFSDTLDELTRLTCPACGREQVIVLTPAGAVDACDLEWETRRHALQSVIDANETKIALLVSKREAKEIGPETYQKFFAPLEDALDAATTQLKKEEAAFEARRNAFIEENGKS